MPTIDDESESGTTSARSSLKLGPYECFLVEEPTCEEIKCLAVFSEQTNRVVIGAIGQPSLLGVSKFLGVLAQGVVVSSHRAGVDRVAHAVLEHHRTCQLGGALQIIRGTVGDSSEHDLLRGTPCQ